jgi:hypothetical protein
MRSRFDAELHHAVTSMPEEDWYDRDKVNAAARLNGWQQEEAAN